jgi:hypothetical protein|tara:strand:+ start:13109 stop:13393 length:285 start_codon:yes stop_codon:yes gene_type:complete
MIKLKPLLKETKAVKLGNVKKAVSLITREYSMDYDDSDIYKFGKDINKLIGRGAGKVVEWSEFEKMALKANKRYRFSKDKINDFMDDFKSNIFE